MLALAKPTASAHALEFISGDGIYTDYLTLEQAQLRDVMLAYELDGAPLPAEHGAPFVW